MERKDLYDVSQVCFGPTFAVWHDLKNMFKVLPVTVCLIACIFQTTFAQRSHSHELKSTAAAIKYSAYGTGIPIVVGALALVALPADNDDEGTLLGIGIGFGALGIVAGPGLGHAYADQKGRFILGSAIRTVGSFFLASGIMGLLWGDDPSGMDWGESSERGGGRETISGTSFDGWWGDLFMEHNT